MDAAHVIHVFTDLEGSSRLWDSEPARMKRALTRHDALARETIARAGGTYVKTTGDGMHAVFDDAAAAIVGALEFQRGLSSIADELSLRLRARCGMHAGTSHARDADYFGAAVNRAARIMTAAHGGQVLLSQAVAVDVHGRLPVGAELRELGRVRLRDLAIPETVYQLEHPQLPRTFPPLRSLDATPNNLPLQATSFVGRHGALREVRSLLADHRLVSIIGPGGIGKTRLGVHTAAEALDDFEDGAWFVDLAATADPSNVLSLVAKVLSVTEDGRQPLLDQVIAFSAPRRMLLVLDNCEHVIDAAAVLAERLLQTAKDVRIVATSREPLRVAGEVVYTLGALAVPKENDALTPGLVEHYPAVALFVERVRDHTSRFRMTETNTDSIVRLCRRLDGIPLAVELAAARLRALPLDALLAGLDDRFRLLKARSRGASARHRTLEAMVQWSYDLLDERERLLFERLSVFSGVFAPEDAEAVCADGLLAGSVVAGHVAALCDKSLVAIAATADDATPTHYRLLETMRMFASGRLEERPDAAHEARARHADHFIALAQRLESSQKTKGGLHDRVAVVYDNIPAAIAWALATKGEDERATALVLAVSEFWKDRSMLPEARRWYERVLALPAAAAGTSAHADLQRWNGMAMALQGDLDAARDAAVDAQATFARLGDEIGVAKVLVVLGLVAIQKGASGEARACFEGAIDRFRAAGMQVAAGRTLVNLGHLYFLAGDIDQAVRATREAREMGVALGDKRIEAYSENHLAAYELERGRLEDAERHGRRARALSIETRDHLLDVLSMGILQRILLELRDLDGATTLGSQMLEEFLASRQRVETLTLLEDLAYLEALRGDKIASARLIGASRTLRGKMGLPQATAARRRLDERLARLRDECGAGFDAAYDEGAGWDFDEAVARARQCLRAVTPAVCTGASSGIR